MRFNHPSIVPVRHFFEEHGTAYIVMEYLEGQTLHALYEAEGTLSEDRLRALPASILDGLEQVHDAGFLRCDIKPGNIMLRDGDTPVLIEFGAAQAATAEHSRMASLVMPGFSPMEQYIGTRRNHGPWTDLFAVGTVLYRGMTGIVPSDALSRLERDEHLPVDQAPMRSGRGGEPVRARRRCPRLGCAAVIASLTQWASGLPRTRSGKIMRRILRKTATDEPEDLGNTSTLAHPAIRDVDRPRAGGPELWTESSRAVRHSR